MARSGRHPSIRPPPVCWRVPRQGHRRYESRSARESHGNLRSRVARGEVRCEMVAAAPLSRSALGGFFFLPSDHNRQGFFPRSVADPTVSSSPSIADPAKRRGSLLFWEKRVFRPSATNSTASRHTQPPRWPRLRKRLDDRTPDTRAAKAFAETLGPEAGRSSSSESPLLEKGQAVLLVSCFAATSGDYLACCRPLSLFPARRSREDGQDRISWDPAYPGTGPWDLGCRASEGLNKCPSVPQPSP